MIPRLLLKVHHVGTVSTYHFEQELIRIGRRVDVEVRLVDGLLAQFHCVIRLAPDGTLLLEDRGSNNGTFVRGEPIRSIPLPLGEEIRLGHCVLVVEREPDPPSSP